MRTLIAQMSSSQIASISKVTHLIQVLGRALALLFHLLF